MSPRLCLAVLAASTLATPALAQQTNPTNPSALSAEDFRIRIMSRNDPSKEDSTFSFLPDIEAKLFFNRARCECEEPIKIVVDLLPTGVAKRPTKGTFQLVAGSVQCVDAAASVRGGARCTNLGGPIQLTNMARGPQEIPTTVTALFKAGGVPQDAGCAIEFQQTLFGLVDADPIDSTPDLAGTSAPTLKEGIALDGKAPLPPSEVTVTGGNDALEVKWTRADLMNDQNGFLVFCSRAEMQVFKPSYYSGDEYQSQRTVCPNKMVTATGGESEAFERLDSKFLCSDLLTTSTEWRIKGLQNGILYQVGVAAVDTHGNASPIDNVLVRAPVPTVDFYDAYRAAGGAASGCAYGGRASGGAATLLLLLALAWRRRR
ncbi:MAG TPA: hypothetical protein VN914_11775 [Polyangia bacterium]|nr:hypothetical protein [Polyangia bacterium]